MPAAAVPVTQYGVYGYWADSGERWAELYEAVSPRAAEDLAKMDASAEGAPLRVCRVITPPVARVDDEYTLYVDPQDPRNAEAGLIASATPDVLRGTDPDWTVLGCAAPAGTPYDAEEILRHGERYLDIVAADTALAAEDVARDRIAEKGGVLLVCGVLAGAYGACDSYATFTDPDVPAIRN